MPSCKHYLPICLILLLLYSCTKEPSAIKLCIKNDTQSERAHEMAEVSLDEIYRLLTPAENAEFSVSTTDGKQIICQQTGDGKLIFPISIKAKASKRYIITIREKKNSKVSNNENIIKKMLADTLLNNPYHWIYFTVLEKGPLRYTIKTGHKPTQPTYRDTQILEIRTTQYDASADETSIVSQYNCMPQTKKSLRKQAPLKIIIE